jgi:PBP1b-binding outer membrane lipoprotein LpoB
MPNRATNYYLLDFEVTELRTGKIVWIGKYEVQVARN